MTYQRPSDKKLGNSGELFVAKHLEKEGFKILATNYKKFYGEIDIIAQRYDLVCFVEVKTRTKEHFAMHEIITPSKQRKIITVAQQFISTTFSSLQSNTYRFDVAFVIHQNNAFDLTYIPNAFNQPTY